jgi:carbonic anhydrase
MSKILEEVLSANKSYAATFGEKAKLSKPPARQFAILTCMDARLDRPSSPDFPKVTPT